MTSKGTERDLTTELTVVGAIDHVAPMAATPSPEEMAPDVIRRIHAALMKLPAAEKTPHSFRAVVVCETQTKFLGNAEQFNDWIHRFVGRVEELDIHLS